MGLDGRQNFSIPIGVEQPIDRKVNRPDHEAAGNAEGESKKRQIALIGILEHAMDFLPANKTPIDAFGSEENAVVVLKAGSGCPLKIARLRAMERA